MSNEVIGQVPFLKIHRSWLDWNLSNSGRKRSSLHPRIRISSAHDEWNHVVIPLIALAKGFFAQEGLEDVELVTLESEGASLEALNQGFADFAVDPVTPYVLKSINNGNDIYIIGPRRRTHAFFLFGQRGMTSPRDLKGGKINVFTPGDEMTVQSTQVIRDAGMVPNVDVKIDYYQGDMHDILGMEDAFRRGEAQGLLAVNVQVERLKSEGFPILVNLQEAYLPRQDRVMVATGQMVNYHHDTVKGFLKGMIRANRYFMDRNNKDEIIRFVEDAGFDQIVQSDRKLFEAMFENSYTRIPPNCHLPLEAVEQAIKEQFAQGNIDESITLDRIVRIKALKEAQQEVGLTESAEPSTTHASAPAAAPV
ncbi:MAG: ABC transporter substrate-binding protein [Deltaproteobacteria bacterium]|nr:ABC transporter substrate-binding protein [Deltaproteobacteria bacterium]